MRYRRLGTSELEVSEIALGSWLTYGVSVNRDKAQTCIDRAFDLGVNFFDTANMYGRGAAESLLGDVLSRYSRDQYMLATKVYFPMSLTDRGLSRQQILKQGEASLKRLRTDYLDLYQCHRFDDETPLEETMAALTDLVAAGKVRYIGFSQWSPGQIEAAAKLPGVARFVSSQPQYSLLHRKPGRRVFGLCETQGIGQIVYSPLAQGVLTGKYEPHEPPPDGSRGSDKAASRHSKRFSDNAMLQAVQRLAPIAQAQSLTLPQLALAWVLRDRRVCAAIIGATSPQQIEENVAAVGVELAAETLAEIDQALEDVVRA